MILRKAEIIAINPAKRVQYLTVKITDIPENAEFFSVGEELRALNYIEQNGLAKVGQTVLIECCALAKNLGTGGSAMVKAILDSLPQDSLPDYHGHIVKARYTPSQTMVWAVEEQDSPYHEIMKQADSLENVPVVALGLHSQLPAALIGIRKVRPAAKVVLVYSDGAALPVAFSSLVAQLRDLGWLHAVITSGQAYGGDLESINTVSGMLAAKHICEADIILVGQGPGNAGTATPYGYSGMELAGILTSIVCAQGQAICCLRMSNADFRERHLGISHHTRNILQRFVPLPVTIAIPEFCDEGEAQQALLKPDFQKLVATQLASLEHHHLERVPTTGLHQRLLDSPVRLSTMGRNYTADPAVFLAAGAAGILAAQRLGLVG